MNASRTIIGMICTAMFCLTLPAAASDGWYLSSEGGRNTEGAKGAQGGYYANSSVGYQLDDGWRVDGNLEYRHGKESFFSPPAKRDDISVTASAIYDFKIGRFPNLHPYLGAGLGITKQFLADYDSMQLGSMTGSRNGTTNNYSTVHHHVSTQPAFQWQVESGLGYDVNKRWSINLDAKYYQMPGLKSTSTTTTADSESVMNSQETDNGLDVGLGVRYSFDRVQLFTKKSRG